MTPQQLSDTFSNNHQTFLQYIAQLPDEQFMQSNNGKWTPGQQLEHIYLCLQPLAKALSSKDFIKEKFGTLNRPAQTYDEVLTNYTAALQQGGKAPNRFVPPPVELSRKAELLQSTQALVAHIAGQLTTYTATELNTLVLPHPLLAAMAIQEMFYLMAYHALHHLQQTKVNLGVAGGE